LPSSLVRLLLLALLKLALADESANCNIFIPRRPLGNALSRAIPAPDLDDLVVVFQEGEDITWQRFGVDCKEKSSRQTVYTSVDFWSEPAEGGLADASALAHGAGAVAVAWTLAGDVWVRVVGGAAAGGRLTDSQPVRANNESTIFTHRTQVVIAADSANSLGGFLVAWASWAQDGSEWGIFARHFHANGTAAGVEWQVNQFFQRFQWQPQLAWCAGAAWALWNNGTGTPCAGASPPSDCATGPMVRNLNGGVVQDALREMPPEVKLPGVRPLAAALACQDSGKRDALVIYLEDQGGKMEPVTQFVSPGGSILNGTRSAGGGPAVASRRLGEALPSVLPASLQRSRWDALLGRAWSSSPLLRAQGGGEKTLGGPLVGAVNQQGGVIMLASNHFLVLMVGDEKGTVAVQLVYHDYTQAQGGEVFPARDLAYGAHNIRAAWDAGMQANPKLLQDQALITCFTTGGVLDTGDDRPAFACLRRRAPWLAGTEGIDGWGMGMTLALGMMCFLLVIFCIIRNCAQRRFTLARGGRTTMPNTDSRPRLRELREELARIPQLPPPLPPLPPPRDVDAPPQTAGAAPPYAPPVGESAPSGSRARGGPPLEIEDVPQEGEARGGPRVAAQMPQTECAICHNEVNVRVALRPCGHTACRDCITRIVEINQTCHICRAAIEGVQPVYI